MAGDGETVDENAAVVREPGVGEVTVTIGRIVHFVTLDGDVVPAIVTRTRIAPGLVDMQVFHFNRGIELATSVPQGDGTAPNTWFWPRRG